mgnify:CR=1 FL=1
MNPEIKVIIYEEKNILKNLLALLDERIATQIKIIEKLESLIRGISNSLLYAVE